MVQGDRAAVLPTADAPPSDNPYISYHCLRQAGEVAIVANGSHVDPAIDKVGLGYPLRDALALSLLAMDYEHDQLNTPRIAAGVDRAAGVGYLAIVAEDRLAVERVAWRREGATHRHVRAHRADALAAGETLGVAIDTCSTSVGGRFGRLLHAEGQVAVRGPQ